MATDNNQLKAVTAMVDLTVTAMRMATATVTAMAQWRWQQQSTTSGSKTIGEGGCGDGGDGRNGSNGSNGGRISGGSDGSHYSAPVKGRGDCCSDHLCRVSAPTTTISAAAPWMPWLKYRWLGGLF